MNNLKKLTGTQMVFLGLGLLVFIVFGFVAAVIFRNFNNQQAPDTQQIFATPIPTIYATAILPTGTPAEISTNIWVVSQTEVDKIQQNGYEYIVDIFISESQPGQSMKAHCMAPADPAPKVGDRYVLNPWGVLVPCGNQTVCTTGDINSKLQRFMPMP